MIYSISPLAIGLFMAIVVAVLAISVYFARKSSSSTNYFAAGGTIPWQVNGIAFAGDYLSAASFLGICGMIAFSGYDGFLYSIGYLAGWIVALFVIAEPIKRLGKYTFADALDAIFKFPGIRLMAGISTLVVSIFYLIPQMVGAGSLVVPLLGLPHWIGVIGVGSIVIFIVATAGMKSTTYVQFIKGSLLIVFSLILTFAILNKGLSTKPSAEYHQFESLEATISGDLISGLPAGYSATDTHATATGLFVRTEKAGTIRWWKASSDNGPVTLAETLTITTRADGSILYNGAPREEQAFYQVGHLDRIVVDGQDVDSTGRLNPISYLSILNQSRVMLFSEVKFSAGGEQVRLWYQNPVEGSRILRPGMKFKVDEGSSLVSKLNFVSLMLALFLGTAALPHVLIRYYTVPSAKDARKSTILAIIAIGFFYILTLFIGLGAMTSGVIDLTDSNMAAPLLARNFGILLFAIISAIAFATVLGTVSGLIMASAGAVAHDLVDGIFKKHKLTDRQRVIIAKVAAIATGIVAILLGIIFKGVNVSFLVGLAFAIAASANFPAIVMILFWKKTTAHGVVASILVGMLLSVGIIMLSPTMAPYFGVAAGDALIPLDNPGIVSIPVSFLTLIIVSLLTKKKVVANT